MSERQSDPMDVKDAVRLSGLWYVGKLIGGDQDAARDTLYEEVARLQRIEAAAREVINSCAYTVPPEHHKKRPVTAYAKIYVGEDWLELTAALEALRKALG